MHLISRACLIFTFFISVACRGPEVDFVFLENVANERLQATVIFEGPDVASHPWHSIWSLVNGMAGDILLIKKLTKPIGNFSLC